MILYGILSIGDDGGRYWIEVDAQREPIRHLAIGANAPLDGPLLTGSA